MPQFLITVLSLAGLWVSASGHADTDDVSNVTYVVVGFRSGLTNPAQFLPSEPNGALWGREGPARLNNIGKGQAFRLGQVLRQRYADLLPMHYREQDTATMSSSAAASQATLQAVMAGLYPPSGWALWNPELRWQPIHTRIADPALRASHIACPKAHDVWGAVRSDAHPALAAAFHENQDLVHFVRRQTGWNSSLAELSDLANNIENIRALGLELPAWLLEERLDGASPNETLERLSSFGGIRERTCAEDDECRVVAAGHWLHHVGTQVAKKYRDLSPSLRMTIYSSNLESTLSVIRLLGLRVSDIGHSGGFVLEFRDDGALRLLLHQPDAEGGRVFVKPIGGTCAVAGETLEWCPIAVFLAGLAPSMVADWRESCFGVQVPITPLTVNRGDQLRNPIRNLRPILLELDTTETPSASLGTTDSEIATAEPSPEPVSEETTIVLQTTQQPTSTEASLGGEAFAPKLSAGVPSAESRAGPAGDKVRALSLPESCEDPRKEFLQCGTTCGRSCGDISGCVNLCVAGCYCRPPFVHQLRQNPASGCIFRALCHDPDANGTALTASAREASLKLRLENGLKELVGVDGVPKAPSLAGLFQSLNTTFSGLFQELFSSKPVSKLESEDLPGSTSFAAEDSEEGYDSSTTEYPEEYVYEEPEPEPVPESEGTTSPDPEINQCMLPKDSGQCESSDLIDLRPQWYWNQEKASCVAFRYTGCGGNQNRFATSTSCFQSCAPQDGPSCSGGVAALRVDGRATTAPDCAGLSCPAGWLCSNGWRFASCCNATVESLYMAAQADTCPDGRAAFGVPISKGAESRAYFGDSCADLPCPPNFACAQINPAFAKCCAVPEKTKVPDDAPTAPPKSGTSTAHALASARPFPTFSLESCDDPLREFQLCGSACPPACTQLLRPCGLSCERGCFCRPGFVLLDPRDQDSECVRPHACPEPGAPGTVCGLNSRLADCGPSAECEASCRRPLPRPCAPVCGPPACVCRPGFLRSPEGTCIRHEECPRDTVEPSPPLIAFPTPPSVSVEASRGGEEPSEVAAPAPPPDVGCEDARPLSCRVWAFQGECEVNPFWMKIECQKSCKCCGCTPATILGIEYREGCEDINDHCPFWSSKGECIANPRYMNGYCPTSCQICKKKKALS